MALGAWVLAGWMSLKDHPSRVRMVLTGVGTGVAGLFQPVVLPAFALISIIAMVGPARRRQWARLTPLLIAGAVTMLVLVPWTVRNYDVHGRLMLVKDGFGKELWMGNNPHATGTAYVAGGAREVTDVFPPPAWQHRAQQPEVVTMDGLQNEALDFIQAHPGAFIQRTAKKVAWFWTLTPAKYERSYGDDEAHAFRWIQAAYWFGLLAICAFAFWRRRGFAREYAGVLIVVVLWYSLVYGLTHVGQARFRGEIEYVFVPALAFGVSELWRLFTGRRSESEKTDDAVVHERVTPVASGFAEGSRG
jgi:4-amino-4-deoxy-L-arabinose transferase-like glycosyltransferase